MDIDRKRARKRFHLLMGVLMAGSLVFLAVAFTLYGTPPDGTESDEETSAEAGKRERDCVTDMAYLDSLQEGRSQRSVPSEATDEGTSGTHVFFVKNRTQPDSYRFYLPTDNPATGTLQITWADRFSPNTNHFCHAVMNDTQTKVWYDPDSQRERTLVNEAVVTDQYLECTDSVAQHYNNGSAYESYGCNWNIRLMFFPHGEEYFWSSRSNTHYRA